MKTPTTILFFAMLLVPGLMSAQVIPATQIEIGPPGSDQVRTYGSGTEYKGIALGSENILNGDFVLAVGRLNKSYVTYTSQQVSSGVFGDRNVLEDSSGNLVAGYSNVIRTSYANLVVGSSNKIDDLAIYGNDTADYGTSRNLVSGWGNYLGALASESLILGIGNSVDGTLGGSYQHGYILNRIEATATLGRGLINRWNHATVVGSFNDDSIDHNSGLLFAVGSGLNNNERSNALEVYRDGEIRIPVQGDISMGVFGAD